MISELTSGAAWTARLQAAAALGAGVPAPHPGLRACIVVPVRNEECNLPRLIDALAAQRDLENHPLDPLVVRDRVAAEQLYRPVGGRDARAAAPLSGAGLPSGGGLVPTA